MDGTLLAGRKLLVTGAAGFIGTRLCERLAALDVTAHAVSRSVQGRSSGSVTYLQADLSELETTRRLLQRLQPDVVIHLAGLAAAARGLELVLPTFESNLLATVNLLTAARELGAPRIVLPGSLEEPERPDAVASSPYAISKWAASAYGRMFHELYGLPVAIGRLFITYGPTRKDPHKLIPYTILSLLDGRAPRLSSGRREVDWVHIDDVVDGLLALATAPQAVGQCFDIGSGRLVSIRGVVERLVALVDPALVPHFDASLDRPSEQVRVADVERTQRALGWVPRVDLERGLADTVDWFREQRESLRRENA
jgi:UDP-glucose 4-epimerase